MAGMIAELSIHAHIGVRSPYISDIVVYRLLRSHL